MMSVMWTRIDQLTIRTLTFEATLIKVSCVSIVVGVFESDCSRCESLKDLYLYIIEFVKLRTECQSVRLFIIENLFENV